MKFYDRTKELEWLGQTRKVAFENHSQMTVVTGRRRIGKTKLILKSCEGTPTAYLFIDRSNEALLCGECARNASTALGVYISPEITSFAGLFETLMAIGRNFAYNLVIDEFQEFFYINPAVYSQIQDIWDRYKDSTHVNFIASGSVYSLMHRIFMDYKEPLYGRCDSTIRLRPFDTDVLKQILLDYKPDYTNDDLLALFTFTGGIPKYIESFMDNGCTDMKSMVDWMMRPNSMFQNEGKALLIQEFGRKYGNYFAILSAIAGRIGIMVAALANGRAAEGAQKSLKSAFLIGFRGGAVMGLLVVGASLFGIAAILMLFGNPSIILGFSFGASSLALFAKAGGGIFTKTADVAADLTGKVELGIAEDDPRNPAVIADNVGDNVGDVAGMGADLFDSNVAAMASSLVIAASLADSASAIAMVFCYSILGLIASMIGIATAKVGKDGNPTRALNSSTYVTTAVYLVLTALATAFISGFSWRIWIAAATGLLVGVVIGITTDYFTDDTKPIVRRVAKASATAFFCAQESFARRQADERPAE